MKTIIFYLFLTISFYGYAQDSVRVVGYGSMADFPGYSKNKSQIAHFEFSKFVKNTILEITLWDFENSMEQTKRQQVLRETLNIKENPRIDLIINRDDKKSINISSTYIGKYLTIFPIKSETELLAYSINSKPGEKNKIVPIMFFIEKRENIDPNIINKITTKQELDLDKNKDDIQEVLSKYPSFKLLTYQLIEE